MPFRAWVARGLPQCGAPGMVALRVERDEWRPLATAVGAEGGFLAALWAGADMPGRVRVHAAYYADNRGLIATLESVDNLPCPGIEDVFPAAARMQRAMTDLSGVQTTAPDTRPWLRHGAWRPEEYPLAGGCCVPSAEGPVDQYGFVRVQGDGVHEIGVGPVHAGVIEPGHFRFSVVGEKVLRLEERLGYTHKGIELRFTQMQAAEGHRLAARVSGDSAVAFSWAYCQAVEALAGCVIPVCAASLRALYLEIERIQNHLGDLGALGNDAGFTFGLAQFSRLKERWLRVVEATCGQRYLMDAVIPGGTRDAPPLDAASALAGEAAGLAREVQVLREIYEEHPGVRDRFLGAGELAPQLARQLGVTGLAGRASGQEFDSRLDLPVAPYDILKPVRVVSRDGDVAARVSVRFDELQESCRLVSAIAGALPEGPHAKDLGTVRPDVTAIGWIEGWRGPAIVALEVAPGGRIRRCHPHDPSWQNWPALEFAAVGNIVPDFPLINKSFNLSYSGHDL
jgi:Ni,Fe-hydrogenase III large subunit